MAKEYGDSLDEEVGAEGDRHGGGLDEELRAISREIIRAHPETLDRLANDRSGERLKHGTGSTPA